VLGRFETSRRREQKAICNLYARTLSCTSKANQALMKPKAHFDHLLHYQLCLYGDNRCQSASSRTLQFLLCASSRIFKLRMSFLLQVTARDSVISDNYTTLQGLRRRCQELETHKFVLGYKVSGGTGLSAGFLLSGMIAKF
jgi:hypothetical protein